MMKVTEIKNVSEIPPGRRKIKAMQDGFKTKDAASNWGEKQAELRGEGEVYFLPRFERVYFVQEITIPEAIEVDLDALEE